MVGRIVAGVIGAAMAIVFAQSASFAHDPMFVEQGGAKMLKLNVPATDVIIADPSVVDVSVQTQNQLVLIGKKYGTTQLIILSGDAVVVDTEVVVSTANQDSSVSVFTGGKAGVQERSFSCYKRCATSQLVSSGESAAGQAILVIVGEGGGGAAVPAPADAGAAPAAQ